MSPSSRPAPGIDHRAAHEIIAAIIGSPSPSRLFMTSSPEAKPSMSTTASRGSVSFDGDRHVPVEASIAAP